MGFTDNTLQWFTSYLIDRTQISSKSILGPILFLIYVNDMNNSDTTTNFIKFADDTTILSNGATLDEAVTKMNISLEKVGLWFQRN